jgi:hypothetical protein
MYALVYTYKLRGRAGERQRLLDDAANLYQGEDMVVPNIPRTIPLPPPYQIAMPIGSGLHENPMLTIIFMNLFPKALLLFVFITYSYCNCIIDFFVFIKGFRDARL